MGGELCSNGRISNQWQKKDKDGKNNDKDGNDNDKDGKNNARQISTSLRMKKEIRKEKIIFVFEVQLGK